MILVGIHRMLCPDASHHTTYRITQYIGVNLSAHHKARQAKTAESQLVNTVVRQHRQAKYRQIREVRQYPAGNQKEMIRGELSTCGQKRPPRAKKIAAREIRSRATIRKRRAQCDAANEARGRDLLPGPRRLRFPPKCGPAPVSRRASSSARAEHCRASWSRDARSDSPRHPGFPRG